MASELARCEQQSLPLALALLDIDHFSSYNQQHGYLKGDLAIKEIAGILQNHCTDSCLAARFQGGQFAVILPGSTPAATVEAMESVRHSVNALFKGELMISIGIAGIPEDAVSSEDLVQRAQNALAQAKIDGLNKVLSYQYCDRLQNGSRAKVLLVDDEISNVKLLDALLRPLDYVIFKAYNGNDALQIAKDASIDLVLLDIMMPGMNGYEVCRKLKNNDATRMIPVIMVTALDETDAKIKGIEAGADDFLTKPPNKLELLARTKSLIKFKRMNDNLTSVESILTSLANVVEAKDAYTQGHVQRVAKLAIDLGKKLGLSGQELAALRLGGILHDIGKIAIPIDILNKPGPLTPDEWQLMMTHANVGYNVCLPLKKTLGMALDIIKCHHEKLDGSGYPDGLVGDEISIAARIMSVVDIYDALISDRPYRKAMSHREALKTLELKAGRGLIDGKVVALLAELVNQQTGENVHIDAGVAP